MAQAVRDMTWTVVHNYCYKIPSLLRYALYEYDIVLTIIFPRHYKSPDLGSISEDNRSHEDIDNCGVERAKHSPIEYHSKWILARIYGLYPQGEGPPFFCRAMFCSPS